LNDRQDLLPVSLLTNLRNLLVGGKQRSEIFKNADEVVNIFESNSSIETVDGRSKSQWVAESTQLSTSTPVPTPRFDRASRLWQNRLIEKADEERDRENKRNEERYLEARRADSRDMMVQHEREKSRITALSRGMRALSMHAVKGVLNRRCQRKCEKEVLDATTMNEEKMKSLAQEKICLESDKEIEAMRRNEIELEQCRESERQVMERMQAEHSSALENAVCSAKGFYSLQLHAVRRAAERALEKSETARRETLEKYTELEAIHAEQLHEAVAKIGAERESREAEVRCIELLTETRHGAEKELTALKCKAFYSLHLHANVRKERRLSEEQVMESLLLLESERRSYEDHVQMLDRNLEANKQALQGLQLASSMTGAEHTHSLKDKDDQIECLQEQLRGAKDEIGILVESTALLRHTDMRLTAEKVADTALITELRRLICDKEDAYAVKELVMQGALEKQMQEHGLLKESHTSLQRRAERAVKRLNSVHDAFLEAVEDRDHLAQTLNDLNDEKAERESTIVELGSCVRQLQTALRNLTHNLSLAQAKAHTSHAVQLLPEKSVRVVEGGYDVDEHRGDGNMRQSTSSRSCDDGDGDGGDAGGFLALNESTDFLNRSSFKSAEERNESNGGRSDSAEPEGDCVGGVGKSPLTSTRVNNAACSSDSDIPNTAEGKERALIPGQQGMPDTGRSMMHGSTASNLVTLRAELEHRTLDLREAGSGRLFLFPLLLSPLISTLSLLPSFSPSLLIPLSSFVLSTLSLLLTLLMYLTSQLTNALVPVSLLSTAERSIADLTKSQTNLQAALQVKVCMLSDQTDIILDLREKLSKASQDREELQDSLVEVEHLLDSSESQRKEIAENLEWRFQREMQLNTKIKSLEGVNSKLRHALEMEKEDEKDSSSSDSPSSCQEGEDQGWRSWDCRCRTSGGTHLIYANQSLPTHHQTSLIFLFFLFLVVFWSEEAVASE
jgi:hypothetical protein